jgi:hypothetical protein
MKYLNEISVISLVFFSLISDAFKFLDIKRRIESSNILKVRRNLEIEVEGGKLSYDYFASSKFSNSPVLYLPGR